MSEILSNNCLKCPEKTNNTCNGNDKGCMCVRCPRNLAECLIVKYCRETESPIYIERR